MFTSTKFTIILLVSFFLITCSKEEDSDTPSPKPPTTPNCFSSDTVYTTLLPNMDFEYWGFPDSSKGEYQEPCGSVWVTSNAVSLEFTGSTGVTASSKAQNGTIAASMVTNNLLGPIILPGILFSGRYKSYDFSGLNFEQNAEFGVPFKEKPIKMEGYYTYTSVNADSAYALVMLSKYNAVSKVKDTVGFGGFTIKETVSSYTKFTVDVDYAYPAGSLVPDSILILFTSSKGTLELVGQAGSTLNIDNCSLTY